VHLLAIDTALGACAAAITADGSLLARRSEAMTRGHAERLAPLVAELAEEAGVAFKDLDRIVVTTGPGSFTGVRVGLAFARSLALALARPCIGVTTIEALALEAGEVGLRGGVIPAPLGIYAGLFLDGVCVRAPAFVPDANIPSLAAAGAHWRGPGAETFCGVVVPAPDIAALALRGIGLDPDSYPPDPAYLRAPDAKLPAGSAPA
jgi:tRNA threonylcarbamoyladenosine biosynthesis protein TsaB